MEKRKKKRTKQVTVSESSTSQSNLYCSTAHILSGKYYVQGAVFINICSKTQEIIGCLKEIVVTNENPWIEVKKEAIEDNLFFYEESSDFYSVKDAIEQYPEKTILVGWSEDNVNNDKNDFLLCVTVDAKNTILNIIKKENADRKRKATATFGMPVSIWVSKGSEFDVDDCLLKNFRNMYEIELETPFPVYPVQSRFSLRLAENTQNGYVEILPGRFSPKLVFRKRYDVCIQTGFGKQDRAIQTHPSCPKGRPTQYEYEYRQITLPEDSLVDLAAFFRKLFPIYSQLLFMNTKFDMYYNDYSNLEISEDSIYAATPVEILNFKNVSVCKGLKVSTLSWNPLISGILAIGYSKIPKNSVIDKEPDIYEKYENLSIKNIVLIWSYTNYLKPQFYLYSSIEVLVLSWCPYKDNILIGGLENGQLAIWDFGSKLNRVDLLQALSPNEQRQRDILDSRMKWMKSPLHDNEMYPTAVSDLECSHGSPITSITWMQEGSYINRNGKWSETSPNNNHMQFLTTSLDCTIFAWDLDTKRYTVKKFDESMVDKPVKKKRSVPEAITAGISDYKVMNTCWYPSYKWRIENEITRIRYPIMSVTLSNHHFAYEAINKQTLNNVFEKTYFTTKKMPVTEPFSKQLYLSTNTGLLLDSYWEGIDYDQGLKTNSEILHATEYGTVHDGPIINCRQHPVDLEMFLSVGGKIFAIWDTRKKQAPIFWRRSVTRYTSGMWLEKHPCAIVVARIDFCIEFWNLFQLTKTPTRIIHLTGIHLINLFAAAFNHSINKNTVVVADCLGSARVYKTDSCVFGISEEELRAHPSSVRYKIETRKKVFNSWLEQWKQKAQLSDDKNMSQTNLNPTTQVIKPNVSVKELAPKVNVESSGKRNSIFENVKTWETAEEKIMYQNLLIKKRINISEIESSKGPMMQMMQEKERKYELLQEKYNIRETIFKNALKSLMQRKGTSQRKHYEVSVCKETKNKIKVCYLREYKLLEEEALKFVRRHSHKFFFNWEIMMRSRKSS